MNTIRPIVLCLTLITMVLAMGYPIFQMSMVDGKMTVGSWLLVSFGIMICVTAIVAFIDINSD